jgi:hypothetical protein
MNYLILGLGLAGLVGCYDIARRMTLATRHSMRLAVIVIGVGCVLAMFGEYEWALVAILSGCGLYRIFDLRTEGGLHGRTDAVGLHSVADAPPQRAGSAHEPADPPGRSMGGVVSFQAHREHHGALMRKVG